jgi:cyanophycin synthetase
MKKKDIEFLRVTYLRGPNIWTYRPVLEAWVDIGELEDYPSNKLPGFTERLTAWLPSLIEHRCGVGERGGFVQRLHEGTWAGHILEHVTIELLNLAGMQTGFGKARGVGERGVYKVVVRARDEQVAREAMTDARELMMAAIEDRPFDVAGTVAKLRDMVDDLYLGPSTACIVDAATGRKIPAIRLNDGNLVQLGYGSRQRRVWTAETDRTSAIAEGIASDKDLTKGLLASCGVPVPEGRIVGNPEEAWEAAEDIGLPVVVKPSDGNHGRGVSIELTTREEVEAAWRLAEKEGSEVIVERFIRGNEHRLLVVGNRVVAAARGEAAWVKGDGRSTVVELIDAQLNTDPRRGLTEDFPLNRIIVDNDLAVGLELSRQNLTPQSVPAEGKMVLIQRNGNVAWDVTDLMHPQVADTVALAARIVGLDIAGIDLVAEDISRPLEEQGGAIVEVNAGPGLLMHLKPAEGSPRPVGRAIVDHLFPENESGRIPIIGVAGTKGTNLIARLVAWLIHLSGKHVGLACSDGLYLDRRQVEKGNCANWSAGERLLINRSIQAAVFENGSRAILSDGLAYDRCQIGVVTDVSGFDDLREYYIQEPEQVYSVLRTQVDTVLPDGVAVLNAADALVAEMAELCDGDVVFYGNDVNLPPLVEHLAQCRRAVFLRDGMVVLATGPEETPLARLDSFPLARIGNANDAAEIILASIATAWAFGVSPDLIAAGIETFEIERTAPVATTSRPRTARRT